MNKKKILLEYKASQKKEVLASRVRMQELAGLIDKQSAKAKLLEGYQKIQEELEDELEGDMGDELPPGQEVLGDEEGMDDLGAEDDFDDLGDDLGAEDELGMEGPKDLSSISPEELAASLADRIADVIEAELGVEMGVETDDMGLEDDLGGEDELGMDDLGDEEIDEEPMPPEPLQEKRKRQQALRENIARGVAKEIHKVLFEGRKATKKPTAKVAPKKKRLNESQEPCDCKVTIKLDREYGEYIVKQWVNGKVVGTYHTDDKQDALDTKQQMMKDKSWQTSDPEINGFNSKTQTDIEDEKTLSLYNDKFHS